MEEITNIENEAAPKFSIEPDSNESTEDFSDNEKLPTFDLLSITQGCLHLLAGIYWFITTALILPTVNIVYCCFIVAPLKFFNSNWSIAFENRLAAWTNQHWTAAFAWYGLKVYETGDDIDDYSEERCILMPNHMGLMDHFILMAALNNKGTLSGRWLWIIFHIWKWTPLGVMWMIHGNYFINGGKSKRERALLDFAQHLDKYYWRDSFTWQIVYPEGSRLFLIRESSRQFALKNNLPVLNNSANPRTGAIYAMLQATGMRKHANCQKDTNCPMWCHSGVRYIIDATLGYPNQIVPTFTEVVNGKYQDNIRSSLGLQNGSKLPAFQVHYRIFNIENVPFDNEASLLNWLNQRWQEKDALLETFYRHGTFTPGQKARFASIMDAQATAYADAFFCLSAYVQWCVLCVVYSAFMDYILP